MRKQHLIDPQICIRCNTCERRCPTGAISHDERNYVVDADICTFCMACVRPCPTGAIDNWFMVALPYTVPEQLGWHQLPPRAAETASPFKPPTNFFTRENPAVATVASTLLVTQEQDASEVRLLVLDFGGTTFPFLEGQSIGIVPPGARPDDRPRALRIYSIASARDGEQPGTNTMAIFVKREVELRADGTVLRGVASNWLCDRQPGDRIEVVGPFGETFLMPDDPDAELLLVGTGTGRAPFRGFEQRRQRIAPHARDKHHMFFGMRTPQMFKPEVWSSMELVYSHAEGWDREHVQDRMRQKAPKLAGLLQHDRLHVYICGSRGLEVGVDAALAEIGRAYGIDWPALRATLSGAGRYHVETY